MIEFLKMLVLPLAVFLPLALVGSNTVVWTRFFEEKLSTQPAVIFLALLPGALVLVAGIIRSIFIPKQR